MSKIRLNTFIQALVMGLFWCSGKLIVLFAVLCFVLTGNDLSTEKIFVAVALYNSCRLSITLFFPFAVQYLFELSVTLKRIQNFLELEEFIPYASSWLMCLDAKEKLREIEKGFVDDVDRSCQLEKQQSKRCKIFADSLTTAWQAYENHLYSAYAVMNVSFEANPGDLIAVIGPVGSGKSSLLSTLICETYKVSGHLFISGKIAYCSQDAWIFNGSLRDNILFGYDYDQKRYKRALELSALASDIEQFPQRDAVLVGDHGASLSGGQRARISLARAIYSNADIYLLDDPLSAVDATVARYLFDKCICGYLRSKIVVLVTHQIQFLHSASKVLLMDKGEIIANGKLEELLKYHAEEFTKLVQETENSFAKIISNGSVSPPSMISSPKRTLSRISAGLSDGCADADEKLAATLT
ncbi:hypothetical protein KIN20_003105 [Parelaphostrongylus tenuis]|uniref:ABC transporter domain-containing protein n=1 Tax=Parelaphostrongylus tenuis TaxID=148309 RepID=A0AAD5LWT5_PARTN|nr:hypothetical protein KIN20_003105 [Parelaphostrongylus tenuis]